MPAKLSPLILIFLCITSYGELFPSGRITTTFGQRISIGATAGVNFGNTRHCVPPIIIYGGGSIERTTEELEKSFDYRLSIGGEYAFPVNVNPRKNNSPWTGDAVTCIHPALIIEPGWLVRNQMKTIRLGVGLHSMLRTGGEFIIDISEEKRAFGIRIFFDPIRYWAVL